MRKTFKKFILIMFAFLLVATSVGCNTKSSDPHKEDASNQSKSMAESASTVEEKEMLKVNCLIMHSYNSLPDSDNYMYDWLKENKNIDIQLEVINEKQQDRMNLMLASGDIPDVVSILTDSLTVEIVKKWGEAGLIIPVDKLIEQYPTLIDHTDKTWNDYVYRNKKDGKLYMIPTSPGLAKDVMTVDVGPFIREDWLEIVGMEAPKTPDELYEVLKAFRDQIPDVNGKKIIPMTLDVFKQNFGYTWTTSWHRLSKDNTELTYYFMDPLTEDFYVYLNKLYRENLLDKEALTQNFDQYMEKLSSGRAGYTLRVYWDMDAANKALKAAIPDARFIPAPILRIEDRNMPVNASPSGHCFNGLTISSEFAQDTAKMDQLMEFLNWNASREGTITMRYGPEGEFYTKNSKGLLEMKPDFKQEVDAQNSNWKQKTGLWYYNLTMNVLTPSAEVNPRSEEAQMGEVIWKEGIGEVNRDMLMNLTTAGPIEQQKFGSMWAEADKWAAKAIYAESEAECREVVKQMLNSFETNGGRDIINERLKSIQDFVNTNK